MSVGSRHWPQRSWLSVGLWWAAPVTLLWTMLCSEHHMLLWCVRLPQMGSEEGERLLVMAATNRPQEIDDAALRWAGHVHKPRHEHCRRPH